MSQLLKQFQSAFGTDPVRFEHAEFAKDGAFSKEVIKGLKDAGFDCIHLKPLTSLERDNFEASIVGDGKSRNMSNLRARLVALSWCDEEGKPVGSAKDIGSLRADVVGGIFKMVQHLNGMEPDPEELKNV